MIDPSLGAQVNDINGGIYPNGLFWTVQLPRGAFKVSGGGRYALLSVRDLPLVDTFQFGSPLSAPAHVDCDIVWRAQEDPVTRGSGSSVAPTDPAAFIGHFAEATATGKASFVQTGGSARTGPMDASGFFAEMGYQKNGVFL